VPDFIPVDPPVPPPGAGSHIAQDEDNIPHKGISGMAI
jgi:hypothetical protein